MNLKVNANKIQGKVDILSSKSELHRILIISALSNEQTAIDYVGVLSKDVLATISCLTELGANIQVSDSKIFVSPIKKVSTNAKLNCFESGSTLRFMLPVVAFLGANSEFFVQGRLASRPITPIYNLLKCAGVNLSQEGVYPLKCSGKVNTNQFTISGEVSSQFISGLLMAIGYTGLGGKVVVTGDFQSKPYVDITTQIMQKFDVGVDFKDNTYIVENKSYTSPKNIKAGGDWSNSAFFACLGALSGQVSINGLDLDSAQGDKQIVQILNQFGAITSFENGLLTVKKNTLNGIKISVKDIPDLVPAIAIVGCFSNGETIIYDGNRLRLKESDRIKSVVDMINSIGGNAQERADGIKIIGKSRVKGGLVNCYNDHRIVMASAIATALCDNGVQIIDAQAVEKSYVDFFEQIKLLGVNAVEV